MLNLRTDRARQRVVPQRCTNCMVGQGRNCTCRKPRPARELSQAEAWWLILAALLGFWALVVAVWRAWA